MSKTGIIRCPYCGSTDVYVSPFDFYCGTCGESWPNTELFEDEECLDSDDEDDNHFR